MRKKRILIDGTSVSSKTDGLTTYIINLIKYFPEESFSDFEYWILLNPGVQNIELDKFKVSSKYNFIELAISPVGPSRDWSMYRFLRKQKGRFDLIHITSNMYPFFLKGGISTIHDLIFRKYLNGSKVFSKMAQFYINQIVKNCLKKAKFVITISEFTKNEVCKEYNLKNYCNKITVIHEGWEHMMQKPNKADTVPKIDSPYLFYLGTLRKHKNITNLLTAFQIASTKIPVNVKLAISGNTAHMDVKNLAVVKKINEKNERVIFTGYLSDTDLENYYKNAAAFIFPSLSEGFGIPVLEAFYHNCPLLCSNTTSLPEIAGDAALYFDPSNPEDIAKSIIHFFASPLLADAMRVAGKERLKLFSWVQTSKQTVDLYHKFFETN